MISFLIALIAFTAVIDLTLYLCVPQPYRDIPLMSHKHAFLSGFVLFSLWRKNRKQNQTL